jgi:hypothetical protein
MLLPRPRTTVTGNEMVPTWWVRIVAGFVAAVVAGGCGDDAAQEPAGVTDEAAGAPAELEVEDDAAGSDAATEDAASAADLLDEGSGVEDATADEGVEETDPYAIPEDGIDEAYVERVLEAIYEVNREALAMTLESESGILPAEAEDRLRAIYAGAYGARQYASLNEIAQDAQTRAMFREPPGSLRIEVAQLVDVGPKCLIVERIASFDEVLVDPPPVRRDYIALTARPGEAVERNLNPTPWVLADAAIDDPELLSCE